MYVRTRHFDPLTNGNFQEFTVTVGDIVEVLKTDRLNTLDRWYLSFDWPSRDTFLLRRADRPRDFPDEFFLIYPFIC